MQEQQSKLLTYILRHYPDKFGLKLEKDGWIDINMLLTAINTSKNNKVGQIDKLQLIKIVKECPKQRFGLNETETKIRANQGHSCKIDIVFTEKIPPKILYHGTTESIKDIIISDGINKMSRQYVHLTDDIVTAINVGKRKGKPIIFLVDTKKMISDGIKFYVSENNVWLTDYVDPRYIKPFECDAKCGCGGFIIFNETNEKCLLVKANNWGFPKGKKNKHESILECAIRELEEETSLQLKDIIIDHTREILYELSYKEEKAVALFVANTNIKNVKIKDIDELNDIQWFDIEKAKELLLGVKNRRDLLCSTLCAK